MPGAGTETEADGSPPGGGTSWDQVDRYAAEALLHDVCDALAVEVFKRRLLGLSALSFVGRSHAADAAGSVADRRTRFAESAAAGAQPAAESNAVDAAAAASLAAGAAEARAHRSFSASPGRGHASGPLPNGGPHGVDKNEKHPPQARAQLQGWGLNPWHEDEAVLKGLLCQMFHLQGLLDEFGLSAAALERTVDAVASGYREVPFHCFRHAFEARPPC